VTTVDQVVEVEFGGIEHDIYHGDAVSLCLKPLNPKPQDARKAASTDSARRTTG
jgi:hypothetical protein